MCRTFGLSLLQNRNLVTQHFDCFSFWNVLVVFMTHDALFHDDRNGGRSEQEVFITFDDNFINR